MSMSLLEPEIASAAGFIEANRRRDQRYSTPSWPVFLSAAISVLGADARPIGHVRDISRGGMRVAGLQVIAVGQQLGLCIALPGPVARQRVNFLKVTARPVWASADEAGEGYEVGYEFITPAKATLRRIDALAAALVETA